MTKRDQVWVLLTGALATVGGGLAFSTVTSDGIDCGSAISPRDLGTFGNTVA